MGAAATTTVGVRPIQQTLVVQGYALVRACGADPFRCDGNWDDETADAFDAWVAARGLPAGPQVITEEGVLTSAEVASVVRQATASLVPAATAPPLTASLPLPTFLRRGDGGLRWGMVVGAGVAVLVVVLGAAALRSA